MITKWLKKILMSVLLIGMALPLFGARPTTRQELEDQQLREFLQGFSQAQPQAQPVRLRPASRAQFMEAPAQRPAQPAPARETAQQRYDRQLAKVIAESAAPAPQAAQPVQGQGLTKEELELLKALRYEFDEDTKQLNLARTKLGFHKFYREKLDRWTNIIRMNAPDMPGVAELLYKWKEEWHEKFGYLNRLK
jgi:hypothetical protein